MFNWLTSIYTETNTTSWINYIQYTVKQQQQI